MSVDERIVALTERREAGMPRSAICQELRCTIGQYNGFYWYWLRLTPDGRRMENKKNWARDRRLAEAKTLKLSADMMTRPPGKRIVRGKRSQKCVPPPPVRTKAAGLARPAPPRRPLPPPPLPPISEVRAAAKALPDGSYTVLFVARKIGECVAFPPGMEFAFRVDDTRCCGAPTVYRDYCERHAVLYTTWPSVTRGGRKEPLWPEEQSHPPPPPPAAASQGGPTSSRPSETSPATKATPQRPPVLPGRRRRPSPTASG